MLFFNAKNKTAPQGKRVPLKMRHPDEFKAAAEATLGDTFVRLRAAEERERNPEAGQEMKDDTVFVGIDPETGRKIFAAPQDESIHLDFNAAAEYVQDLNAKKHLGYADWGVPSRAALKLLHENRHKGALADTFQGAYVQGGRVAFYWSAAPDGDHTAYVRWFDGGKENSYTTAMKGSVRVVRVER